MESIGRLLKECMNGLKQEFVIYGHSVSWWQIFVFTIIASLLAYVITGIIFDD